MTVLLDALAGSGYTCTFTSYLLGTEIQVIYHQTYWAVNLPLMLVTLRHHFVLIQINHLLVVRLV